MRMDFIVKDLTEEAQFKDEVWRSEGEKFNFTIEHVSIIPEKVTTTKDFLLANGARYTERIFVDFEVKSLTFGRDSIVFSKNLETEKCQMAHLTLYLSEFGSFFIKCVKLKNVECDEFSIFNEYSSFGVNEFMNYK